MHPKLFERRGAVLSDQLVQLDKDIKAVCISLAERVQLAGSLCIGDEEAKSLEKQFQTSVECVIKIPAASEEGMFARRALLQKLTELEDFLDSLFRGCSAKSAMSSRQNLDQCRQSLDQFKLRKYT